MTVQVGFKQNIISYSGPFYPHEVAKIADAIRDTFQEDPSVAQKLYAAFIELAVNIQTYSAEKIKDRRTNQEFGIGSFELKHNNSGYQISASNLVDNKATPQLKRRCREISTNIDRRQLRQLKRTWRKEALMTSTDKANIGLVDIALRANGNFRANFSYQNCNHSIFSIFFDVE